MKLKQLLEQLNQLAKEKPEALEMDCCIADSYGYRMIREVSVEQTGYQYGEAEFIKIV